MVDNRCCYAHNILYLFLGYCTFSRSEKRFRRQRSRTHSSSIHRYNMLDAVRHKGQMHLQIDEYYKRYGDVFGMYLLGSLPTLVISDLDMVKEVFVKKFQAFRDRPVSFANCDELKL